jgi:hypothetical protein
MTLPLKTPAKVSGAVGFAAEAVGRSDDLTAGHAAARKQGHGDPRPGVASHLRLMRGIGVWRFQLEIRA